MGEAIARRGVERGGPSRNPGDFRSVFPRDRRSVGRRVTPAVRRQSIEPSVHSSEPTETRVTVRELSGSRRSPLGRLRVGCVAAALIVTGEAHAFDTAAFMRGCTRSCELQWKKGTKDPSSPAHGMTDQTITALCLCNCDTTLKEMPPKLRDASLDVSQRGVPQSDEVVVQLRDIAMRAMSICVPKFLKPPAR